MQNLDLAEDLTVCFIYCIKLQCSISEDDFIMEYSAIVEDMGIVDPQTGQSCSLAVQAAVQHPGMHCV